MNEQIEREINNEIIEITTEQAPIIEKVSVSQIENEISNLDNSIKSFKSRIEENKEEKEKLLQKLEIVKDKAKKQVKKRLNKEI